MRLLFVLMMSLSNQVFAAEFKELNKVCFGDPDYKEPRKACQAVADIIQKLSNENAVFKISCDYRYNDCNGPFRSGYILTTKFLPLN